MARPRNSLLRIRMEYENATDLARRAQSLKACSKCYNFWYCDEVKRHLIENSNANMTYQGCMKAGWKEKDHKETCKHLQDLDLRGLFFSKWEEYEGNLEFPLQVENSKK